MYQTILVPIDVAHLEKSEAILNIAIAQGNESSQFIFLNVIEEIPQWIASSLPVDIASESRHRAHQQLSDLVNTAEKNAIVDVRTGHTYRTILDVAEETKTDLIIVASHKPELQDYLIGSTAAKVVRHAKCSVLVVR